MLPLLLVALLSPPVSGVALAPHYEGTRTRTQMLGLVDEVAALGANHLVLVVQWGQADVHSSTIAPYQWGTDDAEVRALAKHARSRDLKLVIFPILRLKTLRPGAWRGTLAPQDRARWWAQYRAFILHYAVLAQSVDASIFSVGSELGSLEEDVDDWRSLIREVRARFDGRLTYSANWDRYLHVPFWGQLDVMGVNGYHPLTLDDDASADTLTAAWARLRDRLALWRLVRATPLIITEIGYPSVDGSARRPYAFEAAGPVDLEEQRRAWLAFRRAWQDSPWLEGVFVWLWTGRGGANDPGYMPRGKPAEDVLRTWFQSPGADTL